MRTPACIARPTGRPVRALVLALAASAVVVGLGACAPAHDWRELRPEGSPVQFMLPCRPSVLERKVRLAGTEVKLHMHACSAGGQTWAVAEADVQNATLVSAALQELRSTAQANLGAASGTPVLWTAPGSTPNPSAVRLSLQGRLPDGKAAQEQVAVFAHGTRVFQATVVGEQLSEEALETFFSALRLRS